MATEACPLSRDTANSRAQFQPKCRTGNILQAWTCTQFRRNDRCVDSINQHSARRFRVGRMKELRAGDRTRWRHVPVPMDTLGRSPNGMPKRFQGGPSIVTAAQSEQDLDCKLISLIARDLRGTTDHYPVIACDFVNQAVSDTCCAGFKQASFTESPMYTAA